MRRCLRFCLILLAVVLVAVTGAVLGINIHLQSRDMQERLRTGAMEAIGLPLSVRSTIYTPWDGIRLRGLVVPDTENAGVNFLEASEFQIAFRLFPLLRREFVVRRLSLKEAVLTWKQNADGQWRVPRNPELAVARPAGSPTTIAPTAAQPSPAAVGTPAPAVSAAPAFDIRVESVLVARSRILFENRDSWPLLDAEGITARASLDGNGNAQGEARVPEAVLAGLVVARDLSGDFTLERGLLTLPVIRGHVSGGTLSGSGSVATREPGSPYQWNLQLEQFKLQELKLPPKFGTRFEGVLKAGLELAGRNAPGRQIRGTCRLEISDGRLVPSPYLQQIGRVLDIRELQGVDLRAAFADLRIEDDIIRVDPLWLQAEDLAVEMRGTVTRAGQLDLAAKLLLSPNLSRKLAERTNQELAPSGVPDLPDFRAVPFRVTGSLQEPRSDLASRLLGGGIGGQIGELFLNFIGAP